MSAGFRKVPCVEEMNPKLQRCFYWLQAIRFYPSYDVLIARNICYCVFVKPTGSHNLSPTVTFNHSITNILLHQGQPNLMIVIQPSRRYSWCIGFTQRSIKILQHFQKNWSHGNLRTFRSRCVTNRKSGKTKKLMPTHEILRFFKKWQRYKNLTA